jgi:hypothetical protein
MLGLDDIIGGVVQVVNKFIPDPQAQAQMQLELAKLKQADDFKQIDAALQLAQQQTDINKEEAQSSSLFVSGWRPACAWVCVSAFGYHYVAQPVAVFVLAVNGTPVPLPAFDMGTMTTVLMGMLGLGGMRSFDKLKGTSK